MVKREIKEDEVIEPVIGLRVMYEDGETPRILVDITEERKSAVQMLTFLKGEWLEGWLKKELRWHHLVAF